MHDQIYDELRANAESLNDIERTRIGAENRLRSFEQGMADQSDRGLDTLRVTVDGLVAVEKRTINALEDLLQATPFWDWTNDTRGLGTKTVSRLIGAIGDPYMRPQIVDVDTGEILEDSRPRRGPAELWAYCGYHVIDGQRPRRKRGVQANWNSEAKMRAFLCAEGCVKSGGSKYREVYEDAREVAATKVHGHQCQNSKRPPAKSNGCGTQANPEWGAPGSPWRPGHQDAYAKGIVAKEILKDLWLMGRDRQPALA